MLGQLLSILSSLLAHYHAIVSNIRLSPSPLNRSGARPNRGGMVGDTGLSPRKANIGWRKRRRITTIILPKELPRSYQSLNQAFAG